MLLRGADAEKPASLTIISCYISAINEYLDPDGGIVDCYEGIPDRPLE
jgi:hypothetical protein